MHSIRFGTDGWRGILAEDFTFANARMVAHAIAHYVVRGEDARKGVLVGYDHRFASDTIAVSDAARRIVAELFSGAATRWPVPSWYRALTAQLLPRRLRDEFQFPYGPREQRSAKHALRFLRSLYPRLPSRLRYVAPYHEALARLAGHKRPGALTRVLNRLWIGQSSMAIGGE